MQTPNDGSTADQTENGKWESDLLYDFSGTITYDLNEVPMGLPTQITFQVLVGEDGYIDIMDEYY